MDAHHRQDGAEIVHEALASLWPGRFGADPLPEHAPLGEGGLDLDSIELAELVITCEQRAGRDAGVGEDLLEGGPITLGQLIDHLDGA